MASGESPNLSEPHLLPLKGGELSGSGPQGYCEANRGILKIRWLLLLLVLFVKKKEEKSMPCFGVATQEHSSKKKKTKKPNKTLENLQMSPYRTLCFQNTKPVLKSIIPSSHLLVHMT